MTRSATSSITGSWVATIAVTPSARTTVRMSSMIRWPGLGVELAGGLVGEQEPRPVGERPRDRDPLLLAARQLVRPVARPLGEARRAPAAPPPGASRSARVRADEPQRDLDVLGRGQDRDQAERLEDERDRAPADLRRLVLAQARDLRPVDDDGAGRRLVEAAEEVEQRRLARARSAAHGEQLPAGDVDVDAAQRVDDRAAALVVAGQARATTIASAPASRASGRA